MIGKRQSSISAKCRLVDDLIHQNKHRSIQRSSVQAASLEPDFKRALESFLKVAQKTVDDNWRRNGDIGMPQLLTVTNGRKYIKVIRTDRDKNGKLSEYNRSVHAFIDKTTGDILKADTWKRPARGVRGNIFDKDHGASAMTPWGAVYHR